MKVYGKLACLPLWIDAILFVYSSSIFSQEIPIKRCQNANLNGERSLFISFILMLLPSVGFLMSFIQWKYKCRVYPNSFSLETNMKFSTSLTESKWKKFQIRNRHSWPKCLSPTAAVYHFNWSVFLWDLKCFLQCDWN